MIKYPDTVSSNNTDAYGIVIAKEIAGHRTVADLASLYAISDAILSESKSNTGNDAVGQEWWVVSESCYYRLTNWEGRKLASGWTKITDTATVNQAVDTHVADKTNPHKVTKDQVGLGNVDNTSDLNKPVSTAQAAAIKVVQDKVDTLDWYED